MPPDFITKSSLIDVKSTSLETPMDIMIRNNKICLIEDIFKAEMLCHAFQLPNHELWHKQPGKLFDHLYDCDIVTLEMIEASLKAEASLAARKQAGFYSRYNDDYNIGIDPYSE